MPAAPAEVPATISPIPPLLLEGDASPVPVLTPGGPGRRYSLGPIAPDPGRFVSLGEQGDLPESYDTGRLFLAARDPRWLFAAWDISTEEQRQYNARSVGGQLTLRTYCEDTPGEPPSETDVHHDSRHWFVPVPRAAARYVVELGYRGRDGLWHRIARSRSAATPPAEPTSADVIQFGTVPPSIDTRPAEELDSKTSANTVPPAVSSGGTEPLHPPGSGPLREISPDPTTGGEPDHRPTPPTISTAAIQNSHGSQSPVIPARTQAESPVVPPPSLAGAAARGITATGPRPTQEASSTHEPGAGHTPTAAPPPAPVEGRARERVDDRNRAATSPTPAPPVTVSETPSSFLSTRADALAALVRIDDSHRLSLGSLEVVERVRRQLISQKPTEAASTEPAGAASKPADLRPAPSSPVAGAPPPSPGRSFWFNVNAELVVYGATEPGARVTIGGRVIRLRPDGTFSFRFALPDGLHELPLTAVSIDGHDAREARLQFQRSTHCTGDVGVHPQDPSLPPPDPARVA